MATKYRLIADVLAAAIDRGEYGVGVPLPTLQQLMDRFDVARGTARAAVDVLVRRGLVVTRQGVGTLVAPGRVPPPSPARSARADSHVVLSGWADADAAVARALGLAKGAEVVQRVRHHRRADSIVLDRQWLPARVAAAIAERTGHDIADHQATPHVDLDALLRAAGLAPAIGAVRVSARLPTAAESRALDVSRETPVLVAHRTTHGLLGSALELVRAVGTADWTSRVLVPAESDRFAHL